MADPLYFPQDLQSFGMVCTRLPLSKSHDDPLKRRQPSSNAQGTHAAGNLMSAGRLTQ